MKRILLISAFLALPFAASADDATIEKVEAEKNGDTWTFAVTLRHADTGWEDYADGWRIVDEDGRELGIRVLFHPHVDEQPFTRSLSDVEVPFWADTVYVEARTNTGGWGAAQYVVSLTDQ